MYLVGSRIEEIDKVKKLNKVEVFAFVFLFLSQLLLKEMSILGFVIYSILAVMLFKYKAQTTIELRYTFWGLILFQSILSFSCFLDADTNLTNFLSWLVFGLICMESYIMMSPIFFPRIKWWEYDFRYRGDTKVKIKVDEKVHEARLSDLRRDAGAITLFEDIPYDEEVIVEIRFMNETLNFKAKIISKRESNLGRGITYGVSFRFSEATERQRFQRYKKYWSMNNKIKLRNKFRGK